MSTLTVTRQVTMPRVNLLPPEIEEQRRFRRTQYVLAATVVGTVALVGGLFALASAEASNAEDQLAESQAANAELQGEAATYAAVPLTYAAVDARETQLETAMGQEIRWSFLLNDLSTRISENVWVETVTVTQNVDAAATAAVGTAPVPADPAAAYTDPGLGQIVFSGKALTHNDVATWLEALAGKQGYSQPYFTSSKVEQIGAKDVSHYDAQVKLTPEALSERYTKGEN